MMEQDKAEQAGPNSVQKLRPIGGVSRAIADVLVHRRLLTHLIATVLPEAEKARLRALVGADLDRARFLGSSSSDAEQMREHAHAVLDTIMSGSTAHAGPGDRH